MFQLMLLCLTDPESSYFIFYSLTVRLHVEIGQLVNIFVLHFSLFRRGQAPKQTSADVWRKITDPKPVSDGNRCLYAGSSRRQKEVSRGWTEVGYFA